MIRLTIAADHELVRAGLSQYPALSPEILLHVMVGGASRLISKHYAHPALADAIRKVVATGKCLLQEIAEQLVFVSTANNANALT